MDLIEKKLQDEKLSASIMLCVNLESTFKLFSYRVIEPEVFLSECLRAIESAEPILRKQLEKIEHE